MVSFSTSIDNLNDKSLALKVKRNLDFMSEYVFRYAPLFKDAKLYLDLEYTKCVFYTPDNNGIVNVNNTTYKISTGFLECIHDSQPTNQSLDEEYDKLKNIENLLKITKIEYK